MSYRNVQIGNKVLKRQWRNCSHIKADKSSYCLIKSQVCTDWFLIKSLATMSKHMESPRKYHSGHRMSNSIRQNPEWTSSTMQHKRKSTKSVTHEGEAGICVGKSSLQDCGNLNCIRRYNLIKMCRNGGVSRSVYTTVVQYFREHLSNLNQHCQLLIFSQVAPF